MLLRPHRLGKGRVFHCSVHQVTRSSSCNPVTSAIFPAPQSSSATLKCKAPQVSITSADKASINIQHSCWRERHGVTLTPPTRDPGLPVIRKGGAVVVVEGVNDAIVTRNAVNAPVLILGGTNSGKGSSGYKKILDVAEAVTTLVILADPDAEGTRFRNWISEQLQKFHVLHAFLPVSRSVLTHRSRNHDIGNVGIEHASQGDIARALQSARRKISGNNSFTRSDLEEWELVGQWDDTTRKHNALRREIVCNALGVGRMDGAKLLKTLNAYQFPRIQVQNAVDLARRRLPKLVKIVEIQASFRKRESQKSRRLKTSLDALVYAMERKGLFANVSSEAELVQIMQQLE